MEKADMRYWSIYLILVAAIFLPLIGLDLLSECSETPFAIPTPSSLSPQEAEVGEAIREVYFHLGFKGPISNTARLDEFFTDDPRFPLRQELREEVELAFGEVPEGAGYLTYMRAWYKNWQKRGSPALMKIWQEAVVARPRFKSLPVCCLVEVAWEKFDRRPGVKSLEAELGYFPVFRSPMEGEGIPEDWIERFRFFEIKLDGDVATCLYNDWATVRRAYLVNKGGKWYIADSILLEVYGG